MTSPPPVTPRTALAIGGSARPGARFDLCRDVALRPDEVRTRLTGKAVGEAVLVGGEPTLRADLPALLRAAVGHTIQCDGLQLHALAALPDARGLAGFEVSLPAADPAAAAWLLGHKSALAHLVRGLRAAVEGALPIAVRLPLLRPSLLDLVDRVELAAALGVGKVIFERAHVERVDPLDAVALVPDLDQAADALERAVPRARRLRLRPEVRGWPPCLVGPETKEAIGSLGALWTGVGPRSTSGRFPASLLADRCRRCSGVACPGPPLDHAAALGWTSIHAPSVGAPFPFEREAQSGTVGLQWTSPFVPPCPLCAERWPPGAPAADRDLRLSMLRAVRGRPDCVRLDGPGSCFHPDAPDLLRDLCRLTVPRVEVIAHPAAFQSWPDRDLGLLRKVDAVSLYAPRWPGSRHDDGPGSEAVFDEQERRLSLALGRDISAHPPICL